MICTSLHLYLPSWRDISRDSIIDRHWLRQRYVPYAVNLRSTSQKYFLGVSCTACTGQGNNFSMVKWKLVSPPALCFMLRILRCMYTVCSCKSSCACQLVLVLINDNDDDDHLVMNFRRSIIIAKLWRPAELYPNAWTPSVLQSALKSGSNIRLKPIASSRIIIRRRLPAEVKAEREMETWQVVMKRNCH